MVISERTLLAVLIAFAVSIALTPAIRELAIRRHWLDRPNHRSSHQEPTPRLGGVAFIVASLAGAAVSTDRFDWWMLGIAFGAVLLAVTGLLDDLRPLPAAWKFAPQILAAGIAVLALGPRIRIDLPFTSWVLPVAVSAALAVFWIVSMVNAFNFLDGLDGLVSQVAIIAALAVAMMVKGDAATFMLPFAAAMAGFLVWNNEPASIFMGDVGSQFVGYLLAISVFLTGTSDSGAVPMLFLFAPVLIDALVTIVRRALQGRSILVADRSHVFHRLVDAGHSHRSVANLYCGLTALSALAGIAYLRGGDIVRAVLLAVAIVVAGTLCVRLAIAPTVPRLAFDLRGRAFRHHASRGKPANG
jgi:UDP-N-acetylmuramyl pentapeptide phosphotransferase/UDP-N-acetylglucosamine-1-phosphate transferase